MPSRIDRLATRPFSRGLRSHPLILFATSPGTITGVIALSIEHTRMKLPVASLIGIAVATALTSLAMVLIAHFGGKTSRDGIPARHAAAPYGTDRPLNGGSTRPDRLSCVHEMKCDRPTISLL